MPVFPVPILRGLRPEVSHGFGGTHGGDDILYPLSKPGVRQLPVFDKKFFMPNGIPALAFDDGVVTRSGEIGTGGRIQIDHAGGLRTKYFHMRGLRVGVGTRVRAGQPIGTISHNAGGFRLNHLHFEAFLNGVRIDPGRILNNPGVEMVSMPSGGGTLLIALAIGAGWLLAS